MKKHFFNPANTQSSFEESLKEKGHTFISMCSLFTWFNMQILKIYVIGDVDVFTTSDI